MCSVQFAYINIKAFRTMSMHVSHYLNSIFIFIQYLAESNSKTGKPYVLLNEWNEP